MKRKGESKVNNKKRRYIYSISKFMCFINNFSFIIVIFVICLIRIIYYVSISIYKIVEVLIKE